MISRLLLTLMLLPFLAGVSLAGEDCDKAKNRATARYYRCLAKALAKGGADDVAKCRARFEKRLQRADRKDDCGFYGCLLYTSPSPRDGLLSRMPSSA